MRALLWALALLALTGAAAADTRPDGAASSVRDVWGGAQVELALGRPVPWRLVYLDGPPRLVVEAAGVDWPAIERRGRRVLNVAAATPSPGRSAMVFTLAGPMLAETAEMRVGPDGARLSIRLAPASPSAFAARAVIPPEASPAPVPEDGPVTVVLDPGHGGKDPGAEAGGVREADLMLALARELDAALVRRGDVEVVLTRTSDRFVSLADRVRQARGARADLFVSLHADALPAGAGAASGATVYTLSGAASDAAAREVAERHGALRDAAAAPGDEITLTLLDLARRETAPRSNALADGLVDAFRSAGLPLHTRPRRAAAFGVLKAVDVPSALVEVGYLDAVEDRARLISPAARAPAVDALAGAILTWAEADRQRAARLRR